jgi:hypothetical protein
MRGLFFRLSIEVFFHSPTFPLIVTCWGHRSRASRRPARARRGNWWRWLLRDKNTLTILNS